MKIFIFMAVRQSTKTSPKLMYVDCNVHKEIESPDGIMVHAELWQVKTLCALSILSGLFVFNWAKYTSRKLVSEQAETRTSERFKCGYIPKKTNGYVLRLLSTTETKTANDTTAKMLLSSLSVFSLWGKIEGGETSLPHYFSFSHSG